MWVDVSGGRLYASVSGAGSPLLLVHGWSLDQRMFGPQIEPLSQAFRVVVYDRRGFGISDAPPDLRLESNDIDGLLDALGIETAHILGVSQGGRIALRYAATQSKRIRSLILQGAVVDGLELEDDARNRVPIAAYSKLAKAGKLDEVRERWLSHPLMRLGAQHENESRLLRQIIRDYSGKDLIAFQAASYSFPVDVLAAMRKFDRPTLLLTGAAESAARRQHASELLGRIPDCREVIFCRSGHLPNLTEPRRFNETVSDFLSEVERI